MIKDVSKIVKGFDWKRVSWPDREYLINMVYETINSRSYRESGRPFINIFPDAGDYALFNCIKAVKRYREEFYNTEVAASHLLHPHPKGRKYYFVWSYSR
tara:strand:- start:144 stop:443 length:300 start_codon:yes stop_codon:yes gene_type:complete